MVMVGHVAAIQGAQRARGHNGRQVAQRIQEQRAAYDEAEKRKAKRALVERVVTHYDVDGSGNLNRNEITKFLRDYSDRVLKVDNSVVSDEEVNFVYRLCDTENDDVISKREIEDVLTVWGEFLEWKDTTKVLKAKFDDDFSNSIDEHEMVALCEELHGGEVPPEVVEWLFKTADLTPNKELCDIELARAMVAFNLWRREPDKYGSTAMGQGIHVDEDLPPPTSGCCTTM